MNRRRVIGRCGIPRSPDLLARDDSAGIVFVVPAVSPAASRKPTITTDLGESRENT